MNKIALKTLSVQIILSLLSGLIGAFIMYVPAHQELEILRESLERKVNLIMTVVPSYALTISPYPNGTIEKMNSTLVLFRTKNFTFTVYVSNVGDAFAHLLCYAVSLSFDSNYTETDILSRQTVVLKPYESTSFEYLFVPLDIPSDVLLSARYLNLTFMVMSAETSIEKAVLAQFY